MLFLPVSNVSMEIRCSAATSTNPLKTTMKPSQYTGSGSFSSFNMTNVCLFSSLSEREDKAS